MKQYEKYKDSGVEWLGEIPEHWKPIYLKHMFSIIVGGVWGDEPDLDSNTYCIRVANFDYAKLRLSDKKLTLRKFKTSELNNRILEKGDLILEKSGGGEKTPVGRVVEFNLDIPAVCSNFTNRLKPKDDIISGYLKYLFAYMYAKNITLSHVKQTIGIQNLSIESFFNEKLYFPFSKLEQQQIAEYLDYTVGIVDVLVKEKEGLINKLHEKRKALINEVVTKGLNPDAPMRDSGIEWLGEIPEHWNATKINRTFELIGSGTTPKSGDEKYYLNGTINWLNTGDLNDGIILSTSKYITELAFNDFSTLKIYPKGSIVIALYGATIGKLGILDVETTTNQACCVMSDSNKIIQKYLFYFLLASRSHIISMSYGGGQPNISQELIRQLPILQPSIEEQTQIVNYIESRTSKIDKISEELKAQIEKLKEYKTSIISEAVTGKIDLREWVAPKTN